MGPSKRKVAPLNVPKKDEDPAERKRVLNVLAQRRYRQRRKEHVKKLEDATSDNANSATAKDVVDSQPPENAHIEENDGHLPGIFPEALMNFDTFDVTYPLPPIDRGDSTALDYAGALTDVFGNTIAFPNDSQLAAFDCNWSLPSLPSSPRTSQTSSLTSFSSPASSATSPRVPWLGADERNFTLIESDIYRAATSIASRMGLLELLWSLDSSSPIGLAANATADYTHLPANLQPTPRQRSMPHHPIVDLLPWPSVRDKLLLVLSMPEELRPEIARGPTALIEFIFDIEDSAEGVRIRGEDPCSDKNWEVGEKVFQNWWWAFDSEVIRRSNALRKERGAARLLGRSPGTVLGELP